MTTKKTQNKRFRVFVLKYYLYSFFNRMGFIYPFIAILFSEKGLNATQIALIIIASKITYMFTGIPCGVLADQFNRKYILISAGFVKALVYVFWIIYPGFWGFLIGYVLFGLNSSLTSSCSEAFVYDRLLKYYKKYLFERIQGRSGAISSMGIFLAGFSSIYLIRYGYNFLMIISAISYLIGVIFLSLIGSTRKIVNSKEPNSILSYFEILKRGLQYALHKQTILFKLTIFIAFSNAINAGGKEYFGIFLHETTNSLTMVAFLYAIAEIIYALGGICAEFLKKISIRLLFLLYFIASCFSTLAYYIYSHPISTSMILFNIIIFFMIYINLISRTNALIPSRIRTTTISVRGFIESVGSLLMLFLFGWIADYFESYRMAFLLSNAVNLIGAFIFLLIFMFNKADKEAEQIKEETNQALRYVKY
jgi:MFS family permease